MENNLDLKCRICFNSKDNIHFMVKEMQLGLKDEFLYFLCSKCNCLQINDFPENISVYYPSDSYYSFSSPDKDKMKSFKGRLRRMIICSNIMPDSFLKRGVKLLISNRNFSFLSKVIRNKTDRILDVGCGDGMKFLYPLFEIGFRNILGCDPFVTENINYQNGLKVVKKELHDIEGEWDVICFNHSFEHIKDPLPTLKSAFALLPKGGHCILRIPTSSSFAWRHYGTNWFQLDAPRHFFLHSVQSISHLADQTGFKLEDVIYDSTHHQFTISERYKQGKTMQERTYKTTLGKLFHLIKKINYTLNAKRKNREKDGDQAIFYLIKEHH